VYRNRLRYFIDGIIIGSQAKIEKLKSKLTKKNDYIMHKTATTLTDGKHQFLHTPRDVEIKQITLLHNNN
jgi:hypothetical protein